MTTPAQQIGIFTTDAALVLRSWDAWLARVTGIPAELACRQPLAQLFPELAERGLLRRFEQVLAEGSSTVLAPAFHRYLIACPPQAPARHFSQMQQWVTIAPLFEGERVVGTLVTIEDVTPRLERERELAEQLASPDEQTRLRAARAIEADNVPSELLHSLGDASWRVRQAAAQGLARYGGPEALAALLQALREQHHDPSVLNSALQVLARTEVDVAPALIACLDSADTDLRIYAALALGEQRDPRAIGALLGALADPDANVRYHAIEALGQLRAADALDALLEIAESRDFFLAFPSVDALRQIGDARAGARLLPLLDDPWLRAPVAEALGALGDTAAAAPLAALLAQPDAPTLPLVHALAALYGRHAQSDIHGTQIANSVRQSIEQNAGLRLVEMLARAAPDDLPALVLVLGWLDDPAAQRALAHLLSQPAARRPVIEALVRHGAQVTTLLIEQLAQQDTETQQAIVVALGRIGDARALPALIDALGADTELAVAAAQALGAIGDRRAFEPLLALIGHPSAALRQAAIGALNSLGHPDLAGRARELLEHADARVRESAVRIAGYFGYPNCAEQLLARCNDQDERVRRAAIEHLPYLDDTRALPALTAALADSRPGTRAAATRALAHIDAATALPHLLAALADADAWVRYYAARALGQHASSAAIGDLAALAQADPAGHVRVTALEALGQIGGADARARLAPFAQDTDRDIALAAQGALGRIAETDAERE